ncbi:hypothetical protein NAF17_09375 [Mucilaginibacter sp. RB4R14]|uniref:hypothetical protein n=1 Tax=Mucilaginibacter aurantiaciroseus TaxID=2949308 RepID=UPI00209153C8|nr:hypothetical protein [Mucilaginibacter aurantiaciroseus]MCO5935752.1 hypothetical protein [Mucilaginibacter aurantiaciroseus]
MKLIYKLLTAVLLLPSLSYAQGNFKPGYVITLKGDTLKGFISEHEWDSNPTSVTFKPDTLHGQQKYTVADIKQFTIDNRVTYKSFSCQISLAAVEENHLFRKDTTTKTATVFLEELQAGKNVSLYAYSDETKKRFFVTEKGTTTPQELLYRVYVLPGNEGRTKTDNIYAQQLGSLALKYGSLTDKLQRTLDDPEYREPNLVKMVSQINGVHNPTFVKKKTNYTKLTLAVLLFSVIAYLVLFKSH